MSWPIYDAGKATRWQVWLVTSGPALACVELEFDAELYDLEEEDSEFRGGPNHALHAILTLFTFWACGGWAWVWLIIRTPDMESVSGR